MVILNKMENDFYKVIANLDFIVNGKGTQYEIYCKQHPSIKHTVPDIALGLDIVKNEVYNKLKAKGA
jgi:hypothetical protein